MCTGIKVDYKGGCVLGRTMDYQVPLKYNPIYLPRNYAYGQDLMGKAINTKYRVLGICFENRDPLKDGVNEYGLMGITNAFSGFNLYDKKGKANKTNISSLDFLTYVLTNYKSVDELIEDLANIHIASKNARGEEVISPDFHHMFTDSTKRCVVIEPKRKKLVYYENPYKVMTNSPGLDSHIRRLEKAMDLDNLEDFNSSKDLPGGYDPVSRFIKAFYLNRMNVESNNYQEALGNAYNIMAAMTMPNGFVRNRKYKHTTFTRYSCAYDSKHRLLTVKSATNPRVYRLGFEDIDDKDERQAFFLDLDFKMESLS